MIVNFTKSRREFLWQFPKILLPALLIILLFSGRIMAQNIPVSGTVKDVNGEPLIGVSVNVSGLKRGAATNQSGQYTILAPSNGTLEFTYLGFFKKAGKNQLKNHN